MDEVSKDPKNGGYFVPLRQEKVNSRAKKERRALEN